MMDYDDACKVLRGAGMKPSYFSVELSEFLRIDRYGMAHFQERQILLAMVRVAMEKDHVRSL